MARSRVVGISRKRIATAIEPDFPGFQVFQAAVIVHKIFQPITIDVGKLEGFGVIDVTTQYVTRLIDDGISRIVFLALEVF